jgi:Zn-dependent M28 family amino/carboxypeptidase
VWRLSFALTLLTIQACSSSKQPNHPDPGIDAATLDGPAIDAVVDAPGNGSPYDPEIAAMVAAVSGDRIHSTITTLAGMFTRHSCSSATGGTTGIGAARDWIEAQLSASSGLRVRLDEYAQFGCATSSVPRHNVVAVLPGAHPSRIIIIGGHYDSLGGFDSFSSAPGANDSGSQTSVVLEAARVMAGQAFDATLVFVAFAGEEQHLVGSTAFANKLATAFPGGVVEAMLNCDIVGGDSTVNDAGALQQFRLFSPGTPREVFGPTGTTDDTSPSRGVMRYIGHWGATFVPSMTMLPRLREDRPSRGGDHEPFIDVGVPGVRFIETNEELAHQHNANDLVTYVTPSYTARVTQVVVAVAASLARAPTPPTAVTATGNAAAVDLRWSRPAVGTVDHYVVAARAVTDNLYARRVRVEPSTTSASLRAADLGIAEGAAFYISVAAVDSAGHESLFAYPEYRCGTTSCVVPAGSLDVTAQD